MKSITTSGKRKSSVARAVISDGNGKVTVNRLNLDVYGSQIGRLKISEPLILAKETSSKYNINITVSGGGIMTQADASRLAIARALVNVNPKLKELFLEYDRHLLVADIRVKEAGKPNHHGQARAGTQTSYR